MTGALKGIYCAIVTPLDENEDLDEEGAVKTIKFVLDGGVDGLLLLGSTGEQIALTAEVKRNLIRLARRSVATDFPLIVGCGATSTRLAIRNVHDAEEAGADAVILTPPCFYPFDANGLYAYYTEVAKESHVPVYLYNISRYVGMKIPVETVRMLMDNPRIRGIKESDRDLAYVRELLDVSKSRNDFTVIQGSERVFTESFDMGCTAGVTVIGNIDPLPTVTQYKAWLRGDRETVDRMQRLSLDYVRVVTSLGMFPQELKICMKELGLIRNTKMTSPFPGVTEEQYRIVADALHQLRKSEGREM